MGHPACEIPKKKKKKLLFGVHNSLGNKTTKAIAEVQNINKNHTIFDCSIKSNEAKFYLYCGN